MIVVEIRYLFSFLCAQRYVDCEAFKRALVLTYILPLGLGMEEKNMHSVDL